MSNEEKVIYTRPISLYRIIVNSTFNTVCFLILLILSFQYFYLIDLWLETLLFQIVVLSLIITFTITEYKRSFFIVTKEYIQYYRPSNAKKSFKYSYNEILGFALEGSNLVLYDKKKKRYPMHYIEKPKDIVKELNRIIKK